MTSYVYDPEDQLVEVRRLSPEEPPEAEPVTIAQYRYDGLGRRIEKTAGDTITRYVYDNEDIVLEYISSVRPEPVEGRDNTSKPTAHWIPGPGIDEPLVMERDLNANGTFEESERFFYHADGLGSIVALTDSTGKVVERYRYDSFGEPTILGPGPDGLMDTADDLTLSESAYGNPFLFTGREWDPETGLYYYRARYYDSHTGRFLQEDPIGLTGGTNLYRYVGNNPVQFLDPYGLDRREILVITQDGVPHTILEVDDPTSPTGKSYFDFFPRDPFSKVDVLKGKNVPSRIRESTLLDPTAKVLGTKREWKASPIEDKQTIEEARRIKANPPTYNVYRRNCFSFTGDFFD